MNNSVSLSVPASSAIRRQARARALAFACFVATVAATPALIFAADTPRPATPPSSQPQPFERGTVRAISGAAIGGAEWKGVTTSSPVRVIGRMAEIEKETVPFLGVETGPVGATLAAQLNLTSGAGLVVSHVLPDSPAAAVLKTHDILLKLDDQILVESRQLAVLIRQRKNGDELTLTYLRGGKEATAKVKLTEHEVPKLSLAPAGPTSEALLFGSGGATATNFEYVTASTGAVPDRGQTDRMLSLVQARQGQPFTLRIDQGGPVVGVRSMSIDRSNSSLVYNDEAGVLDLNVKDGVKTLVAKNAQGEPLFSGPVTTEEERKKLPEAVRLRLEKLEGMQDVTFRTDGDFQRTETKVVRPLGRGVSLPVPARPAAPLAPSRHF